MARFFTFVILPVLLTSFGEFLLKFTLNAQAGLPPTTMLETVMNPYIAFAFLMIFGGGIMWLVAMSMFELSFLYPFLSINFLIIVVGSQFLLGESVSMIRYVAVFLIVIGLVFISRSKYSASHLDDEPAAS